MAKEDEPLTIDKIRMIKQALDYFEQEAGNEALSYAEILDIDLIFNQIEGKGYYE